MKTITPRFPTSVLTAALAAFLCSIAYGQDSPMRFRLAELHMRVGQMGDFEAMAKLSNEAFKKAGVPWRETWATTFGEGGVFYLVSPIKNYAQFDEEGPITKLSVEDRISYLNFGRNAVESAHYKIIELANELSLQSERKELPKLARVTVVHALPGKALELEAIVKELLLPALKAAGVKDFWVHRTLQGGRLGEYTYILLFEKWADLDALPTTTKLLGDNYAKYMARIATSVADADSMIIKHDPKLSYRPEN